MSRLLTLVFSAAVVCAIQGCSTTNPTGHSTSPKQVGKDVLVTFPAWTTEEEKYAQLNARAPSVAATKCGGRPYRLVDVSSERWKVGELTSATAGHRMNSIAANVECDQSIPGRANHAGGSQAPPASSESSEQARFREEIAAARRREQELLQQLDQERQRAQGNGPQGEQQVPTSVAAIQSAHALVIGNGAYPGAARLVNPISDATAIGQKLRSMGFVVTVVTDLSRARMLQSLSQFRRSAAAADVSLLYFAGHGVQIDGTNYVLPVDIDNSDVEQATLQGLQLDKLIDNFLPGKAKLVFLDACRDNPLQRTASRSISRGLAPMSVARGTLIAYATRDGQVALDGVGQKHSPFTQALLEHLSDPADISVVLRRVRDKVEQATKGKQVPWDYGSLTGGELVLSSLKAGK